MPGTYFRKTGGSGCGAWREGERSARGRAGPQGVEGVGPAGGWDPAPAWIWSWEGRGSQPGSHGRGSGKEPGRRGTVSQARRKRGFGVLGGSPCHCAVGTRSAERGVRKGRVGGVKFLAGGVLCPPRPYRKRGACLCARVCPCVRMSVKLTEGRGTKEGSQTEKLGLLLAGLRPQSRRVLSGVALGRSLKEIGNYILRIVSEAVGEVRVAGDACGRCQHLGLGRIQSL